jgi:uncharacterized protein DUF1829
LEIITRANQRKTIQQLLTFAGDGHLRDGNETSDEFRSFLAHIPSDLLQDAAEHCLATSFTDGGLTLQDIVNQVGRRLGFQVEDGRYRGVVGEVGFDGIWRAGEGAAILVEVKTTDAFRLSLDTTARYRRALIKHFDFAFPAQGNRPEGVLVAVNNLTRDKTTSTAFSVHDVRLGRGPFPIRAYALINDVESKPSPDHLDALRNYGAGQRGHV